MKSPCFLGSHWRRILQPRSSPSWATAFPIATPHPGLEAQLGCPSFWIVLHNHFFPLTAFWYEIWVILMSISVLFQFHLHSCFMQVPSMVSPLGREVSWPSTEVLGKALHTKLYSPMSFFAGNPWNPSSETSLCYSMFGEHGDLHKPPLGYYS